MAAPMDRRKFSESLNSNSVLLNKHARKLLCELNKTRKLENLCDGVVVIDGEKIKVQKALLYASSHYFRLIFDYDGPNGNHTPEVSLSSLDISKSTFETILDYIYTSHIELTTDNIQDILQAADVLLMSDLKKLCCDYLEGCITLDNCLGIKDFATRFNCPWLAYTVSKYIDEHFMQISITEEFKKLDESELTNLLSRDTLEVNIEDTLLESICYWYGSPEERPGFDLLAVVKKYVDCKQISTSLLDRLERSSPADVFKGVAKFVRDMGKVVNVPKHRGSTDIIVVSGGIEETASGNRHERKPSCHIHCMDLSNDSQWLPLPPMETPRAGHGMVACGGCIYMIGGYGCNNEVLQSACKFDFLTGAWSPIASMAVPRYKAGWVSIDDNIYAIGGSLDKDTVTNSMESYNIFSTTWSDLPPMNVKRYGTSCAALGKKIYVIGGISDKIHDLVECFDTETEMWTTVSPLQEKRFDSLAVSCYDILFVFDGKRRIECPSAAMHGENSMKVCGNEVYSPENNAWKQVITPTGTFGLCARPFRSSVHAILSNREHIYAVGRMDMAEYGEDSVRILNSNSWMTFAKGQPKGHLDFSCCMVKVSRQRLQHMLHQ